MQQAVRISDHTAFFLLGELVEYGATEQVFSAPGGEADRGLHHGEVRIMRSRFDEQLAQLERELIEMGALCEESIALAAKSLRRRQYWPVRWPPLDTEIDRKERDIESLCLKLLLQQQPVARDLRQISAALKMITDLERIGDQAEDIAEIVISGQVNEGEELLPGYGRLHYKNGDGKC